MKAVVKRLRLSKQPEAIQVLQVQEQAGAFSTLQPMYRLERGRSTEGL